MEILGKLQELSSLSNSIARCTDLTKITTYRSTTQYNWLWEKKSADTYLVKFQSIKKIVEFTVFGCFLELDIMLL